MKILEQAVIDYREQRIKHIVNSIYMAVLQSVIATNRRYYVHSILTWLMPHAKKFYRANMTEIITGIQRKLPTCKVQYTIVAPYYDISKADYRILEAVSHVRHDAHIIVDWSILF